MSRKVCLHFRFKKGPTLIYVQTPHRPGVVGATGAELARYHGFTSCFSALNVPPKTDTYMGLGYDTSYNRNGVIDRLVGIDPKTKKPHLSPDYDWVQIWDDDHMFAPDALIRLLDHMYGTDGQTATGVDVIVPLYAQRQPPCHPCIYKTANDDGSYNIFLWRDLEGKNGLIPVVSAGAGGILIRRRVVEALADPWFERQGKVGEDHYFLKKVREAGFGVYCALDVQLDHLTTVATRPHRDDETGRWCGEYDLGGKQKVTIRLWDESYRAQAA